MPKPPEATHLTASMRVVATHVHMRHVTAAQAREEVLQAAMRVADGSETPEILTLRLRLEKATGVPIAELAKHAASWPT